MLYKTVALGLLAGGASAFSLNMQAPRASGSRAAVSMQVAEASVASPTSLAKARRRRARAQLAPPRPSPLAHAPVLVALARTFHALPSPPRSPAQAADEARGLAIDSISKAASGHMGLPLGCAEIGAVLYGQEMQYNPADPTWLNRDRFVLSAGHGSMFLYSWLHMAGFDISMDEVSNFRAKGSKTPGHPEWQGGEPFTPGIESTTGPLGQGVGNGARPHAPPHNPSPP